MEHDHGPESYCCRSCGAALQVRVGFRGTLVWDVDLEDPNFGDSDPRLEGEHKDPRLVCSADVMHSTGFRLLDGRIVRDAETEA